jgi:hypothetical protein
MLPVARMRFRLAQLLAAGLVAALAASASLYAQDGTVPTIRQDVREGAPVSAAPPPDRKQDDHSSSSWADALFDDPDVFVAAVVYTAMGVTTPFWAPPVWLNDNWNTPGYFPRFPYDQSSGYISTDGRPSGTRPMAGRFDLEYIENFDHLENLSGRLLIETTPRFGLDAGFSYLDERLSQARRDRLWLGDCNLVYRFAQGDWGEFRTGLGANWLTDSGGTDLGFNFTYAADIFPVKPWVISSGIDWGTLGRAQLFRFRATAGVILHGIEAYTGYEYADIGRGHWNGLVAGLRLWF